MLKPGTYDLLTYQQASGDTPFDDWLADLDFKTRQRIFDRVARMRKGQFGDYKRLDVNLYELRIFFGPGYRVYFAERNGRIIILLTGGDKSSQTRDIKKAKEFLNLYIQEHP